MRRKGGLINKKALGRVLRKEKCEHGIIAGGRRSIGGGESSSLGVFRKHVITSHGVEEKKVSHRDEYRDRGKNSRIRGIPRIEGVLTL